MVKFVKYISLIVKKLVKCFIFKNLVKNFMKAHSDPPRHLVVRLLESSLHQLVLAVKSPKPWAQQPNGDLVTWSSTPFLQLLNHQFLWFILKKRYILHQTLIIILFENKRNVNNQFEHYLKKMGHHYLFI